MYQVAYDITSLTYSPYGGIAQVCYNSLLYARKHPQINPIAYYRNGDKANCKIDDVPVYKLSLLDKWFSKNYDIVHSLCHRKLKLKGKKAVYTVHDVWSLEPNRYQNPSFQKKLGKRLKNDIINSDHIITISETTRKNLLELDIISPEKCSVAYLGVNIPLLNVTVPDNHNLLKVADKPFVLYVGCLEIRKNIKHVIDAVLPLKGVDLVVVGNPGYGYESVIKMQLAQFPQDRLHLYHKANRNDLGWLYQRARATLLPSWEEGFGLPLLEAMASGCPVITTNRSANAEIVANGGILIDPERPEQSRLAVERLLDEDGYRAEMIKAGNERLKYFSWEKYFLRLVEIYRQVIAG